MDNINATPFVDEVKENNIEQIDVEKIEELKKKEKMTSAEWIRTILIYVLCIGVVVGAIVFAQSRSPDKTIFGFRPYTVLTGSMEPTFDVGDMVFVKSVPISELKVDDVITFSPDADGDAYLTHRVVEKIDNYQNTNVTCFRTKGDANNTQDAFLIDQDRVIGKVIFHIPNLGSIVRFYQLKWYIAYPLTIMAIITIILVIRLIKITLKNRKDAKS